MPESLPAATGITPAPPEVIAVYQKLVAAYFPALQGAAITIGARAVANPVQGGEEWAATGVFSDPGPGETPYMSWVAMDVWEMLDERGREALVLHELHHMGQDGAGRPRLVPHDSEIFNDEVGQYGLWWIEAARERKLMRAEKKVNEMAEQISEQDAGQGGVVWADPGLQEGDDFHIVDLGNGNLIALSAESYQCAMHSIMDDADAAQSDPSAPRVNWNGSPHGYGGRVNWNGRPQGYGGRVNWNGRPQGYGGRVNWNSRTNNEAPGYKTWGWKGEQAPGYKTWGW